MFQQLRTVIYHVADLAAAKDWYTKVTGVPPYFDEPFYAGFSINGFELGLDPDLTQVVPGNQSVAYWSVANAREAVDHLLLHGASLLQDVTNVGGPIHVAVVQDPFGNAIGVIEGAG